MSRTGQIPWARIVAEGLAIIASILLAFAIQAWWDGVQHRNEERNVLLGLRDDFADNDTEVAGQIRLRTTLVEIARDLTAQVELAPPRGELMVSDSIFVGLLTSPTFDPITSTLDAALSSGQVALIQSTAARRHLADWRRVLVGLHENELAVRDVIHSFLAPELSSLTRLGPASALLADRMVNGLGVSGASESRLLGTTSRLEGAVGLYLFNSALVQRDLRRIQEIQRDLLDVLETELSR